MTASIESLGIDQRNVENRLTLVEEIWESIAADPEALLLTHPQRDDLDRRIAEHEASPESVVAWAQVKAAALQRTRR